MPHAREKPAKVQNTTSTTMTKENREGFRARVVQDLDLQAELRCGNNKTWSGKAVNLSLRGMLLEFPKGSAPLLQIDERVSVKLCYDADIIWIPGIIRHRHRSRVGIQFPESLHPSAQATEQAIARILRAVERGWIRQSVQ